MALGRPEGSKPDPEVDTRGLWGGLGQRGADPAPASGPALQAPPHHTPLLEAPPRPDIATPPLPPRPPQDLPRSAPGPGPAPASVCAGSALPAALLALHAAAARSND